MTSRKGGFFCICRGCYSRTGEGLSLFSIPKDRVRAEVWLKNCNRLDLIGKNIETLHKNYKLCELHFEEKHLSKNGIRKTLFQEAYPTVFSHLKYKNQFDLTEEPSKKLVILEDSRLKKKLKKSASPAPNLADLVTEESKKCSRPEQKLPELPEVNSRTTKIKSEVSSDQNEGPKDQTNESKVDEFERDNEFEVLYLNPKIVCTKKPSESVTETDETSESNGFEFVDTSFLEMEQEPLDSQRQKPEQVSLEYQHICRICLGTSNLTHLTRCQSLVSLFVNITNIQVEVEDNLPKFMCADCIHKLKDISNFICVAKKNDEKLKQNMLLDEEMKIEFPDNVDEESLSVGEDISHVSREAFNYDSADIDSVGTELSIELDKENPVGPELFILNNRDLPENDSMMPLLERDEREQNSIETERDFHHKSLENHGPKLSTSTRKDYHSDKKNDCICWKCGVLCAGIRMPKAMADVPLHRLKFCCWNCSKSKESVDNKPIIDKTESILKKCLSRHLSWKD